MLKRSIWIGVVCVVWWSGNTGSAGAVTADTILVNRVSGASGVKSNGPAYSPAISASGRFVAFQSVATNLGPHDPNEPSNVFVRDLDANRTTLVSRASGVAGTPGDSDSEAPTISGDGRFVAFTSLASNLSPAAPPDGDLNQQVFVRDLKTGRTTLVSRASGDAGAEDEGSPEAPAISGDGRLVAFDSDGSNLSPDDHNNNFDVFVRDLHSRETTLVSQATGTPGSRGEGQRAVATVISRNGRFVAFASDASNLTPADRDHYFDVYVRDLHARRTTLVSRANGMAGTKANGRSYPRAISADGRFVLFDSTASNLARDDPDRKFDVFVRDLRRGRTTLVSRASGAAAVKANNTSQAGAMSADGRFVTFESSATNLSPDDGDENQDVFVRDLRLGTTTLMSRASGPTGPKGRGNSDVSSLSASGRVVVFDYYGDSLSPDDPDTLVDVYARDIGAPSRLHD